MINAAWSAAHAEMIAELADWTPTERATVLDAMKVLKRTFGHCLENNAHRARVSAPPVERVGPAVTV